MALLVVVVAASVWHLLAVLIAHTPLREALYVCELAFITMLRVTLIKAVMRATQRAKELAG